MLAISDLHVAYGQSEVLHGLNVSVAPNEIVAIMGRNGMGKTTLMKSLMGILPTRSGSVTMEGSELSNLPSYERVAKGLAYVPQGRMIFGSAASARAIASCCCWPPERLPPRRFFISSSTGNNS